MAIAECGKVLALLSLAASLLLLLADAPSSFSPVADLLHAALGRLLDLATRRNMVLLCHAILLVLLGDAGLLGTPARPRRGQGCSEATATATTSYCYSAPERRSPRARRSNVLVASTAHPAAMDGKTIAYPMNGAEEEEEDTVDEGEPAVVDEHGGGGGEEDLDEMNRRFEAFIADTKAKMRLEALQTSRGTTC